MRDNQNPVVEVLLQPGNENFRTTPLTGRGVHTFFYSQYGHPNTRCGNPTVSCRGRAMPRQYGDLNIFKK